jgi:hypothetical protein
MENPLLGEWGAKSPPRRGAAGGVGRSTQQPNNSIDRSWNYFELLSLEAS